MKISTADIPGLERQNLFVKIIRIFSVPIMNTLPASLIQKMMRKTSRDAGKVVETGGSTHALEVMYTRHHRKLFSRGITQGIADYFWHHIIAQPQALRNRLKIVHEILRKKTADVIQERKSNHNSSPVSILSIAGGSSRSIISALLDLKKSGENYPVEVITLDKDQTALEIGKRLASGNGLSESFSWIQGTAKNIGILLPGKVFDIVEIVGLLDYFPENRVIRTLQLARSVMREGGYVIIANVQPNPEIPFVHKTGWPQMFYRLPKEIENILKEAGFVKENDIITEPLNIHIIAIGKK
jgi:SAM-dependent methyltransferase